MKTVTVILLSAFLAFEAHGQTTTIWDSLKTITTNSYSLQIPHQWRELGGMPGMGPEQYFEASGLVFPKSYNGAPVILTIFVARQSGSNLEEIKKSYMAGYRSNPDREFSPTQPDSEVKYTLASGEDAFITRTWFYRKSKNLNQSRMDLITYSKKEKVAYLYTISLQYSDSDYSFDNENDVDGFGKKLFSYFKLR